MDSTNSWFTLRRHEDPPPADPAAPPTDPAPAQPATDGKDWKAEAERLLALSRKHEDHAKANAAAAKRLADLEAAQQSDLEKVTAARDEAVKRAADATARAVRAEVRSLADGFADREDAVLNLGDLATYVKDGEVDTAAITAALSDVLSRKPHLAKSAPAGPTGPKPDPGQGARAPVTTDFATADRATFAAEAAKYRIRPRTY